MRGPLVGYALCVLATLGLSGGPPGPVWVTKGYDAFRRGSYDPTNLYVSSGGALQPIHRFDVNNDGHFDLIFNNTHDLNYTPPAYQYRFAGREAKRLEYVGAGSVRVRVMDLNGDGFPDLVIARGFDNSSRLLNSWVYWGGVDGWVEKRHIELPTHYVQDFCIGDFNHDGRPDLAFVASGTAGVNTSYVYWGAADGFSAGNRTGFETPGAAGCLATDLDGDGTADLVVTGAETRIYWSGQFDRFTKVAAKDTRGAARLDGRVALGSPRGVEIFTVKGREASLERTLPFEGAGAVAAGDGKLVVTRAVEGRNWETRSRVFLGSDYARYVDLPTMGAMDAAIADVDGDGYSDIVFANSRSNDIYDVASYIYWGGADGYDTRRRTEVPTHGAQAVSVAGRDVLFANTLMGHPAGNIDTYIYFGDGKGGYSEQRMQRLPTIGGYESCLADLNDDGFTDLVLVGSHEGDNGSSIGSWIFWGARDGLDATRRTELPTRGAIGCAVGDVDRDGHLDLLFSNIEDNTVSLFLGGAGGFDPKREVRLPVNGPRFPLIADLDKDGWPELLVPSIKDGLVIYWGTPSGYSTARRTVLPGITTVSVQAADLDGDGWLDLILCNLRQESPLVYHGVNTQIYWGSAKGYSTMRRMDLPSLGAHHAVVADFNHDGFLDVFISNYQSEFTRSLDSHIYWGGKDGFAAARRQALHNESAAGVVAGDFNGDGWVDLAVSNHVSQGDHHSRSRIFWNGPGGFSEQRRTELPTVGPHMMTGVDQGNIYTRELRETYVSEPHDAGSPAAVKKAEWEGETPYGARVEIEVRGAESREGLEHAPWSAPGAGEAARWWQYRLTLRDGAASSPRVTSVKLSF